MELQQLEEFYAITQCGSLTKAAQKLHTSQPSISRNLRALEEELGCALFDRVGRNVILNDAGRFMLERALSILNSAEAAKQDIDQYIHDGDLSVDLYSPVPMGEIEQIIIGFKTLYPNVRLRIASWPSEHLKAVQPSITFFASPRIHTEPNYLMLGTEHVVLAAARTNPLAQCASVRLSDLADQPFVEVLSDSPFRKISQSMFLEAGFEPNMVAEDQDYNRMLAYVANDFGVSIAPEITWFGRWRERIAAIPFSDIHRKRYLYLKWPENAIMNWATLRFRDYLIEHFNETYGFDCHIGATADKPAKPYLP